jgi:nucleoside-diphosphate-sugar epimerase
MDAYQPEKIALTGATGALGFSFLRRQFQRRPASRAVLLVRSASTAFKCETFQAWLREHESRVTLVEGDIREVGSRQLDVLRACDGGLWHFAAVTALDAGEEVARQIHEVNVEGTRRLTEAWLNGHGSAPFFHISTAYVAGERCGTSHETEGEIAQKFRNPYEASKQAAETFVRRDSAAGVHGAIFRPSVVVDDQSGTGGFKMVDACAYAVALAVKRGEPFVFRLPSTAHLNLVHSDWVIAAMGDLARMPSGSGRTYHLAAPHDTYLRDIATILEGLVPALKISFEPELKRAELPTASKIFDKAVTDLRPYLEADIRFDRTNTERDLSPEVKEAPLDLAPFVESRLRSELGCPR